MESIATAAWVLSALLSWGGVPATCPADNPGPCAAFERIHGESVADYAARLETWSARIVDAAETPAEALDLASIGFEESRFAKNVDNGICNVVRSKRLDCDSGRAFTVFQLRPDLMWKPGYTGHDLLVDPNRAARAAFAILLRSPDAWTTWPRAKTRADRWLRAHPAPLPVE